jgi:hypothetical protein
MKGPTLIKNCYTSSNVPGYKVVCNHGLISASYTGIDVSQYPGELSHLCKNLLEHAAIRGANAIINLNIACNQFSMTAFGDAVTLDPE